VKAYQKIIFWLFAVLLFFVPLILWPFTSEVFEFNKIVLVYIITTLITGAWAIQMVKDKKFIFRRTILDIPILVFVGSQIISTIFSIDPSTSFFGYYSRFNGGLLSTVCYALLYWAFVTNIDSRKALRLIYITLASAILVSIYGVLEHFGIDKNVWQQDVQSRVFSTLGQPNWLAAWIVALIPVVWLLILKNGNEKAKLNNSIFLYAIAGLFFTTLLFTGSRSGLIGLAVAGIIFWSIVLISNKWKYIKQFFISGSIIVVLSLLIGTQFTPSLKNLISKPTEKQKTVVQASGTALETGGTESGQIRKIVWKGAFQIWKHYPIFGTGVETFAYSYYLYRPLEHNLTSEWDFIYNKAHNEYLNFAANSGTVGLASYLVLISFIVFVFVKLKDSNPLVGYALLAGYSSILVTNFFGFSVVPIQLEFFLFPAIAFAITKDEEEIHKDKYVQVSNNQKTVIGIFLLFAFYLLISIFRYWYADYLFATGKGYYTLGKPDVATKYLIKAIKIAPNQALFYGDSGGLATSYANLALSYNQQKDVNSTSQLSTAAITEITKAIKLSPANVNYKRVEFGIFVMLSTINKNYLINAKDTLMTAIAQAPNDAKLYYNLGLIYARTGQLKPALQALEKSISLKSNYKEARLAYAMLLIGNKQNTEAKAQLEYILGSIDPNDSLTKQTLESIK
jgi:putative inorganic carbon (HCO3(-)) transporter